MSDISPNGKIFCSELLQEWNGSGLPLACAPIGLPVRVAPNQIWTVTLRITHRLNAVLERWFPEQRLFLKSENNARFLRLRPLTQICAIGGGVVVLGWTLVASAILAINAVGEGGAKNEATQAQHAFEQRLTALSSERDARATEALAAQDRFSAALAQVSQMQSQLLQSDTRLRELESGIAIVQASLQEAQTARDMAMLQGEGDGIQAGNRVEEFSVALDILSNELKEAASARLKAEQETAEAQRRAQEIAMDHERLIARNNEIFTQIEDAVNVSVEPLEDMFRKAGINSDELLRTVRRGYSGTGGPLGSATVSTRGNAEISQEEARAQEILISLDQINTYRIAMDKMPLAMPVKSAFRFTSPYGRRWGRMHEGIDFAAPVGTPIYSTGEGEVIFAGWQRGYGNLIKIRHALGTETRYAHLSKIRVSVGQKVSRGALIGDMGNTGRSTGPHLHYEIRVDGRSVDPMSFIKAAQNVF